MSKLALKTILFLLTLGIGFVGLPRFFGNVSFATCSPACSGGKYECQNGTMCCTGGGCPTWCCDACCAAGQTCPWNVGCSCSCGTCGGCTVVPPPPPCNDTNPGTPTAVSPVGYRGTVVYPIVFSWSAPGGWGTNCGGNSNHYRLYVNGAQVGGNISATTYSWIPTICANAYTWYVVADNGARSSGNSNTLSFWFDQTTPTSANSAPKATFSSPPTQIRVGSTATFISSASDPNNNLTLLGQFRRPAPSGTWVKLSAPTGTPLAGAADYTAVSGSYGSLSQTWTPTCSDAGNWHVAVNAVDGCSAAEPHQCTGNPDCNQSTTYGACAFANWYDCGPGDTVNVAVLSYYTLSFHVANMGEGNPTTTCPALNYGTAPSMGGVTVTIRNNAASIIWFGTTDPFGNVTVPLQIPSEVTQFQVAVSVPNPGYCNGGYTLGCDDNAKINGDIINITPVGSCGTVTKNLGVMEAPSNTWYTAVDGNLFATNLNDQTCNTLSTTTYGPRPLAGSYINQSNDAYPFGFFVHSDNDITTSGAPDVEGGMGGFAKKLFAPTGGVLTYKDGWLSKYIYTVPTNGAVTTINNLNGYTFNYLQNSGNNGLYQVTADVFNAWASSNALHTFTVNGPADNSGGLAILYVTGGAAKLTIGGPIRSNAAAPYTWGRLLIVTDRDVEVGSFTGSTPVGVGHPAPGDTTDIEVGILTTKSLSYLSKTDIDAFDKDTPLLEIGPIISKQTIQFGRDLLLDNKYSPAHMIRYNASFVYKLTKSERAHTSLVPYTGLFQMDTQWKYEN